MVKKSSTKRSKKVNQNQIISQSFALTGAFSALLAIGVFVVILLENPAGLDTKLSLVLLAFVLFITSLAPAQYWASRKATTGILVTAGTILLAIAFTLVGMLLTLGVVWLAGLLHV